MGQKIRLDSGELSRIYQNFLKDNERFNAYYEIARKNTEGKIWVIGGYLYRNLLGELYGMEIRGKFDVDFLIETPPIKLYIPEGWEAGHTRFSDLRIEKSDERIDFNPLTNIRAIIRKRIAHPSINDFLEGTPFNIDSMAYDLQSNQIIIGEKGLEALRTRTLEINDYESMKESKPEGISIMESLMKKASGLEFRVRINPALKSIITVDERTP